MVPALWAVAVGIGQVAFWPSLPGSAELAALGLLSVVVAAVWAVIASAFRRKIIPFLGFLLGTCWALFFNHHALEERLPATLHGTDHRVTLKVTSLPQLTTAVSSFSTTPQQLHGFRDARFEAEVLSGPPELIGKRLRLGWYRLEINSAQRMTAGSRWQMTVRLKEPRGNSNPYTFDFESWLLQRGIYATGYVRDRDDLPEFIAAGNGLDAIREHLREKVSGQQFQATPFENSALMRALLLGDRGNVRRDTQALLQRTGTAHLLAISGLHVGMVAGFFLLMGGAVARGVGLLRSVNPLVFAGIAALTGAILYTLISGAPLSARRALIMTAVAIAAWVSRRRISSNFAFALALALVLLLEPLAVLSAGFWLSFVAVAALLLRFQGRVTAGKNAKDADFGTGTTVLVGKLQAGVRTAIQSQWAIMVGLLLPSALIFGGVSVNGLLLNLIAIPWVGLVILPLILLGALAPEPVAIIALGLADANLGWLIDFLGFVDTTLPGWQLMPSPSLGLLIVCAGICAAVVLLPRGVPGRALGWCLIPALLSAVLPWQRARDPVFTLSVLDVGQGLAVVAASESHTMVFDTGASSGNGWNAGAGIVAPYLLNTSGRELDLLAISHGDLDHAGGTAGVLARLNVAAVATPGRLAERLIGQEFLLDTRRCVAGRNIQLGEIKVDWLWPRSESLSGEENDHSCVALLRWRGVRVLLTGDISAQVERQLAAEHPEFAPVDLLVAPHHGSRTSSSLALIRWAAPQRAVFSAGYRHHFGHPHPAVVQRLRNHGVALSNTADAGALRFQWRPDTASPMLQCARASGRFWLATGPLAGCD